MNEYLSSNSDYLLVNLEENLIIPSKRQLSQDTALQPGQADRETDKNTTNVSFPANGWVQNLPLIHSLR